MEMIPFAIQLMVIVSAVVGGHFMVRADIRLLEYRLTQIEKQLNQKEA